MKKEGMEIWMKGNGNLYRLTNQAKVEAHDRNIIFRGRNWVIRPMTD